MAVSPARLALRSATGPAHETLDALFARFDLADRASYAAFLQAHAAALLPVEAWLETADAARVIGDWPERRRGAPLREDLAALGAPVPPPLPFAAPATITATAGVLYVIEGSRLGGRMLARQVGEGLPHRYLDPGAGQPSWPGLLAALDAALPDAGAQAEAAEAALAVFTLFEAAARAHSPKVAA